MAYTFRRKPGQKRRMFGQHDYERRRAFGWPVYSPQNVRSRLLPKHLKHGRQGWWVW